MCVARGVYFGGRFAWAAEGALIEQPDRFILAGQPQVLSQLSWRSLVWGIVMGLEVAD